MIEIKIGQRWQSRNVSIVIKNVGLYLVWFYIPNSGKFSEWDLDMSLIEFNSMIESGDIWLDQN